jgi:hypothetical protein
VRIRDSLLDFIKSPPYIGYDGNNPQLYKEDTALTGFAANNGFPKFGSLEGNNLWIVPGHEQDQGN